MIVAVKELSVSRLLHRLKEGLAAAGALNTPTYRVWQTMLALANTLEERVKR